MLASRPLEGLASALTATQARLLVRINHGGLAPEPAACVAWVLKLPYTLTSENAQHCLPAAQCIRATLFGKVDDLQFAPLRGHILIRKISPSHAWLCSMAQVEPVEATDHEPAAICDSGAGVVRNGRSRGVDCRLAGWLRFGWHREHRRSANREPLGISHRQRRARG